MLNARNNDITTDQMLNLVREKAVTHLQCILFHLIAILHCESYQGLTPHSVMQAKDTEGEKVKTNSDDEEEVRNAFSADNVKRIDENEGQGSGGPTTVAAPTAKATSIWGKNMEKQMAAKAEVANAKKTTQQKKPLRILKRKVAEEAPKSPESGSSGGSGGAGLGLLAGYGSSGSGSGNSD